MLHFKSMYRNEGKFKVSVSVVMLCNHSNIKNKHDDSVRLSCKKINKKKMAIKTFVLKKRKMSMVTNTMLFMNIMAIGLQQ